MYNDNYNIITTNSKSNNRRKINCVICYPKIQLELVNEEEFRYKCPRCKNDYQILDNNEGDIIQEEDILESSHDSEEDPVLVTADYTDTIKPEHILNSHKPKSDIKIPWYMKDSETTKVTHYRED